ncbi:MAG: hypothetical protein RIT25_2803 [Planctomycetota bacterium]
MSQDQELEQVARHVRAQGLRWTSQRELIVRTALSAHDHYTAEELLERCQKRDPRVSRATVYRTLSVLESAGVVEGLDAGDGPRRFEHVINHDHHDHMVCTSCGAILEFRDEQLERRQEAAARAHGFTMQRHSLRIYGTCSRCSAPARGARGGRTR